MAEITNPTPKVNEVAKKLLFDKRLTAVDLANAMGLSNDSAYKLLRRTDWRISEMVAAGDFLKYNLFELFVPKKVNTETIQNPHEGKDAELDAMKRKMELMEQENKYLKELVEMAKMKLKK
ncbi:MAG: hypothetical protein V4615_04170 [Bacteroidota bacterium]